MSRFCKKCNIHLDNDESIFCPKCGEKLVDEFNEFLFDFTSKIPVNEIEKAKQNNQKKKDVVSPYTKTNKKNNKYKIFIISIIIFIVICIVGYFIVSNIKGNDFQDDNITYTIRRNYEHSK